MILVTGGAGFVGRNLVEHLARSSVGVRAMVRSRDTAELPPGVDVSQARLQDADSLRGALDGVGTVVHLASKHIDDDGTGFSETNVEGTRSLCNLAVEAGVRRFIYLSSAGVYGHRVLSGVTEDEVTAPDTPLSRSKLAAEQIIGALHRERRIDAFILRQRFVYGPGDRHFIPRLTRAVSAPAIPCRAAGRVSVLHVGDLCRIIEARCSPDVPRLDDPLVHVCDGQPVRVRQIIEMLADEMKRQAPRFLPIPFSILHPALRTYEVLTGSDPESSQRGLTSLRLRFLEQDCWLSNDKLRRVLPELELGRLSDHAGRLLVADA